MLAAAAGVVSRQALACAARPLRPRRRRSRARARRSWRPGRRSRRRRSRARRGRARARAARRSGARPRPASSSTARWSACRSRPVGGRGSRASRGRSRARGADGCPGARRRGALVPLAEELPHESSRSPRSRRDGASRRRAPQRALRSVQGRVRRDGGARRGSSAGVPVPGASGRLSAASARDPRPAAGLYVAKRSPSCSRGRRSRSSARELLAVRRAGRAAAGAGARRGRSGGRQRPGAGHRRGGASRCARGGRRNGRGARLRNRPRLPAQPRRARAADRAAGLVVSEYAPGVEPAPWRFPARNRIVAGPLRRDSRRRGSGALRRADHGRLRARGGA